MNQNFFYDPEQLTPELQTLAEELAQFLPLQKGKGVPHLYFEKANEYEGLALETKQFGSGVLIRYSSLAAAARGITLAVSGIYGTWKSCFQKIGIMLDLSRNQVFTVQTCEKLFRQLAALGYNTVYLYCEDTYQPDIPGFGYLRGAYSAEEIRRIDAAGSKVGIEVVACIQTLGHMEQLLRWRTNFYQVTDTREVLLAGEEKTYDMIAKMLDFWCHNLRTKRIHVGMDETQNLGRGRFMNLNGYKHNFEIFNDHMKRVEQLCLERGVQPMIWSDMYFRFANANQSYYDSDTAIPPEIRNTIPANTQWVYWDYYNKDTEVYDRMIRQHKDLGHTPVMASGIWVWQRFWYDHAITMETIKPCIESCRSEKLQEIFFTLWGDDGCYCPWFSCTPGLVCAADLCYGIEQKEITEKLFRTVFNSDFNKMLAPTAMHKQLLRKATGLQLIVNSILFDDILLGIAWRNIELFGEESPEEFQHYYEGLYHKLNINAPEGLLLYALQLVKLIAEKLKCRGMLLDGYRRKEKSLLKKYLKELLPSLLKCHDDFVNSYRTQWLECAKPFGLEVMQNRFAGTRERYLESGRRVQDFLDQKIDCIEELEPQSPPEIPEQLTMYAEIATPGVTL